jgi:translation initiation factor 3 subunit A
LKDAEAKHKENVELKHRVARLVPFYESFRESVHERRHDEFEKRRRDAERELEKQIALRKREFRERKLREKKEREERERILREEEERAAKEAEEKAARDEKKRQELAELKAVREKERKEAMEIAALQERRAEEAAKRRAESKLAAPTRGPVMERSESSDRRAPLPLVGVKAGGWREKERLRAEGKEQPAPPRNESPMARASPMGRAEPMERNDSSERPSGPPRLALAGGKPSWREREAAKAAGAGPGAGGEAPQRVPSSGGDPLARGRSGRDEDSREEPRAPPAQSGDALKPSGSAGKFVPPHLRNRS